MHLPTTETDLQVRFTDIDLLGHVSNNVYLQFFDMGRIAFFEQISKQSDCPFSVVARIEIDMLQEIKLGDKVMVKTWCTRIGKKSMDINQNIYTNGECSARGKVIVVGFDRETRQTQIFPENWLKSK